MDVGLIGEQQKNTVFAVVSSAAIILLFAWHILISCNYPYYFIWDMDHVTSLDTVLMQSGLLPVNTNHTGFGMYLPLFFTEKIAHFFDVLSVLNLEDIAGSLNPLAAMAELTDFVRLHSPFLSIGIAGLLSIAIYVMFGMSRWLLLFFFVFLGTQESLTYHSSMVRTEFYSVFYWAGAVVTMVTAAKTSSSASRLACLLATGLLLGLCFLTKVQSLFYLAAMAVLLLLVFSILQDSRGKNRKDVTRKNAVRILAVSLGNVIAFLLLCIVSYLTPIPEGLGTWTWASKFCITPMSILFFLVLLLLFLCQLILYLTNKVSSDIFKFSCFFSIIAAGFILSFALHFLLYSDANVSLKYMLVNFKMMFLRKSHLLQAQSLSEGISNLQLYMVHNPMLFIVNIALNLFLVFGYRLGFVRMTKGQVVLCLLVTVLAFANIIVVTRLTLKDILWKEVLINFLNLFYFAVLVSRATRYRLSLTRIGSGLLIALFFANCIHAYNMPDRIDAAYNRYGWLESRWFRGFFGENQHKYGKIMLKKYDKNTMWMARAKAVEHKRIRRTAEFVFKNQAITHRNIGIAFEGFSVWSEDLDYRITKVPSVLRGAILVDNASAGLKRKVFFKEKYVRQHFEYLDKFKKPSSDKQLSVLTRLDLKIFLFAHADDVGQLVTREITKTPYKIALQNTERSIELQGLEIRNYCEIPLDKITQKFFFVIRKI